MVVDVATTRAPSLHVSYRSHQAVWRNTLDSAAIATTPVFFFSNDCRAIFEIDGAATVDFSLRIFRRSRQ